MCTMTRDVKLTYDDLLRLPDDDLRHELIGGVHYVTASPTLRHQRVLGRLYLAIGNWLDDHSVGEVYFAPVDVVLSPFDVVVPDLLFMSHARASTVSAPEAVRGMPELLIEVLSPSTRRRDQSLKRALYEREGVAEYWVVDPLRDTIRVYRRQEAGRLVARNLSAASGDVLCTPLLSGLTIALPDIFR